MQNSDDRPRFTLFAPEDAEAMTHRERTSSTATLPPPAPTPSTSHAHLPTTANAAAIKYFEQRASSYTMRPSQTFYGGRDSIGNDTDASIVSSSVADGSGGSSGGANSFQQQTQSQAQTAVTASGVSASASAASRARLSVCQDVSNTFEDMFETDWEGYVWKQGHVVRSWRYRYAVLSGTTLTYYVSKDVALVDTEKFRGRVTVTGARRDETRAYGVLITTTIHKVFALYTRSTTESELWIQMIQRAVAASSGHKPSLSSASVTTTRTSDPPSRQSTQLTPTLSTTAAILTQSVRSSLDWKTRNLNTLKQFYALWSAQLLAPRGLNESPAHLLALFPLCATDMLVNVKFPPSEFLPPPTASLFGREGLVDVALSLSKFVQFRRFSVTRYLNTKHPHVLHVLATGKLWNRALQREFAFTTRDEVQLSPGGRVLSLTLVIDVDAAAFQLSDADRKTVKNDRAFHATTSKRVLSLSIQHFHVNRVLGKGTFGTVVLAERKNTREVFAVKILEKSSMSNYDKLRTKTEMRILRDVHHPFIAPLRFSFQSHSRVFLGMEYYPGGSLYTHMNRFSANKEHRIKIAIDLQRVKFYAAQIVLALCHLHACDIVYRDLKPDNIMIDEDGNIALVDFGLSKTSVSQLSGARTMAGSPAYTAPELLKPKRSRDYGKAVDWWCLGILIYEMLLAKRPFHHLNVSVLYKLIEKDPVKFPPKCSIPAEARSLIAGLLEKDPTKRLGARQTSDLLTHPFFRDVKWDLVLRKRIEPPWIPPPVTMEDEKLKNPDINYDKFLASKTSSTNNFFSMFFSWRSPHARAVAAAARRKPERDNDTFGKFSYVSDTTNSFLVDEDEMLDAAFTGRRSIQLQTLSADA